MNNLYAVIMAGGGGTRLWPLSRAGRPKQSLPLIGDRTLFQLAIDRLTPWLPAARILVVTIAEQAQGLAAQTPILEENSFVLEPSPKGTASVIGLAAAKLASADPDSIMACLTADHYIGDVDRFGAILRAAAALAAKGELVTLGITPTDPATGYGYVHLGEPLQEIDGFAVHRVRSFKEKPSAATAREYVASGEYCWNSGMFVWQTNRILGEIERLMPELHAGLQRIQAVIGSSREAAVTQEVWEGLQAETIDYGVMERAEGVVVIRADDLAWLDIGNWDRLFEILDTDSEGNIVRAHRALTLDTKRTLIYQAEDQVAPRLITALGVEDLVIVETQDAVLICPRDQAERVRELVTALSDQELGGFL